MKALRHILQQPFVAATGLAALVHSTWALGTLFAGQQPEGWHLVGWLLPALLIAFALDVGQIQTSAEIREYGLTPARGFTFVVFAAATYYLQWLYIAHHMPALELAPGVRQTWAEFATVMRDAAVWVIPALLPLSTLLYTFSGSKTTSDGPAAPDVASLSTKIEVSTPDQAVPLLSDLQQVITADNPLRTAAEGDNGYRLAEDVTGRVELVNGEYVASYGAWSKAYSTEVSAQRGLSGYKSRLHAKRLLAGTE